VLAAALAATVVAQASGETVIKRGW
jgi:hypothetical protein